MKYFIIFGILYVVFCQENEIHFIETPVNKSVTSGTNSQLNCKVSLSENHIKYRWIHNNRIILSKGNLYLKSVSETEDAGEYICEVENTKTGYKMSSSPAYIQVHWIDSNTSVILQNSERQIKLFEDAILNCKVNGSGSIKVDWLRNGERISKSERISFQKKLLILNRVNVGDNGVYRCNASNEAGYVQSSKNFILSVSDNNSPVIKNLTQDKIVKEGLPVTLNCVYENADIYEWYFQENGPLFNISNRLSIFSNGSLYIHRMEKLNEGLYSCVGVSNKSSVSPQKYTIILSIAVLMSLDSSSLDPNDTLSYIVPAGGNFTVKCIPPFGKPQPIIKWKNPQGKFIGKIGRVRHEGRSLIIRNFNKESDVGVYSCRAENLAGIQEVTFTIVASNPPVIKNHPLSKDVNVGFNVTFSCEYEALPYPFTKVYWMKDNAMLIVNSSRTVVDVNDVLHIIDIEPTDAGNYSCVVNSSSFNPVMSQPAVLNVKQTLRFHPLPIGKKMELGLPNKISCKAESKLNPVVKWIKGISASETEPFAAHIKEQNGTLYFNDVKETDKGQYTCIATSVDENITVTVDIDVVVTPKFTVVPKNPTEGVEGSSIILDCVADGDPLPTIQWDSKLVDISAKRFHTFLNGSLLINELHMTDEGIYGCTAGNSGGFNRTEALLIVKKSENFKSDGALDEYEGDTVERTIIITLGAAIAYILLVVILIAWCRYRRKKKKQLYLQATLDNAQFDEDTAKYNLQNAVEMKENMIQNGDAVCNTRDVEISNHTGTHLSHLDFSKQNIHDLMLLGKGEFGSIYLAQNRNDDNKIVMIKVLEDIKIKDEFSRQCNILSQVQHEHLVKLILTCTETKFCYMILEYTDWGDLKQFLIATRKSSVGVVGNKERPAPLTLQQSMNIIRQLAAALEYTSNLNYTHRDLATRNCLISSNLNVKITFSSLCKDTYAADYCEIRQELLPLRWLPMEAVIDNKFSIETDVYSFACLVWEIFMKAELPFSKYSNKEVLHMLEKRQLHWKLPKLVPTELGTLLKKCWALSQHDRPTFSDLHIQISNLVNNK